ncbi:BAX inhibitor (BI)-1/YccA family protein [Tetragenococcus osmophilus]|uniref:BAX inhibitor (BI)-1/YccA family protein n=1 Tax=Tetragenococcus osmophilus TaxID=526944 RepID=A0AA37XKP9_9ENTE|nr:Bax inhibitor-1/YccA family protein [Tetragenococcus osmophilus]AYW48685.1 BAX inhibitor (BI)-1/YccA family protein [Tetragenococcus osmophilus]GMA54639.1 membrane protein [Alicyclobacillus contaminans]GMA71534.1 membrane protein [Tetragenococcus osmophilus]
MNNNPAIEAKGVNHFYAKVYSIFALGLGISAISAYFAMTVFFEQTISFIDSFPLGLTGIWLAEIILVVLLSAKAQKNPSLTVAGFIVYSLLNGLVLSITLSMYTPALVGRAFATATATFLAMALYGAVTKRDLSGIGRAAIGLLIGVIVATLINFFLQSSAVDYLLSYLTVAIFLGLTAYDNQQIRNLYFATAGQENTGFAAFMALQLYLDFINLFLSFLRIFSRN